MPSLTHEGLILLFRNAPALAAELLRDVLHAPIPTFDDVHVGEADVTEAVPITFTADLVVVLERAGKPVCALIIEPQLDPKGDKRRTWPHYMTGVRAKLDCDVVLLVVTVDEAIARWAATPIPLGHPGFCLTPLVLGPKNIPSIVDPIRAKAAPELAVLGVMAHGRQEEPDRALEMAKAALVACQGLEGDRALHYVELVFVSLNEVAKTALEKIMASGHFEFQSDFALKHRGAGRAEGRVEGRMEGRAEAVLLVLEARGLPISDETRTRILACTDLAILDQWVRRAATITAVDELFRD